MKYSILLPLILLLAAPVHAEQSNFIYTKTIIKIVPKPMPELPQPATVPPVHAFELRDNTVKAGGGEPVPDSQSLMPVLKRAPKEFTVEVRSPNFLTQKDFIEHQPFTDREGLMIDVNPAAEATLTGTRMIASADVLFVDPDGLIIKIAPDLKLSTLTESIDSGRPIRAFVYLKAGTSTVDDIQIGDHVENNAFKTHPTIIQ